MDEFLIAVWEAGGGGDFWLTTLEYVACLLQILLVDLDQSTNLSQNVRMHVP